MRDIAKLNENDKKALFHNTAAKMGMTDAIIMIFIVWQIRL